MLSHYYCKNKIIYVRLTLQILSINSIQIKTSVFFGFFFPVMENFILFPNVVHLPEYQQIKLDVPSNQPGLIYAIDISLKSDAYRIKQRYNLRGQVSIKIMRK